MKACRRQRQEKNAPTGRGQTPLALQEQSLNIPSSRISSHVISCLHASSLIFSPPLMVSYLFSLVSSDHLSFFVHLRSSQLFSAQLFSGPKPAPKTGSRRQSQTNCDFGALALERTRKAPRTKKNSLPQQTRMSRAHFLQDRPQKQRVEVVKTTPV